MRTFTDIVARWRIGFSRVFGVGVLVFIVFSVPPWKQNGFMAMAVEALGFIFLIMATAGRVWSSLYIAGRKDGVLTTQGPYSIVRNPLYVFSFIGAAGVGLTCENIPAALLIMAAFCLYYPFVIRKEERMLEELFGQEYVSYKARVPRWLPRLSLYSEPEEYTVHPRQFRRSLLDAMWFLWAIVIWEVLEKLHFMGILPAYW